jgi:hypothetical protein
VKLGKEKQNSFNWYRLSSIQHRAGPPARQLLCQKSVGLIKVKYNFVGTSKSAQNLLISAQKAQISVNFCSFLLIFGFLLFCD